MDGVAWFSCPLVPLPPCFVSAEAVEGRSALVVSWMPGVCIINACVVPEAV